MMGLLPVAAVCVIAVSVIFCAAGRVVPPMMMPITFFVCILFLVADLAAVITYGRMKKWSRVLMIGMTGVGVLVLAGMIYLYGIMVIAL